MNGLLSLHSQGASKHGLESEEVISQSQSLAKRYKAHERLRFKSSEDIEKPEFQPFLPETVPVSMETESQDINTKDKLANSEQSQTAKSQGSPQLPCPVSIASSTFHPQNQNRFTKTHVGIAKILVQRIRDSDKGNDDLHGKRTRQFGRSRLWRHTPRVCVHLTAKLWRSRAQS